MENTQFCQQNHNLFQADDSPLSFEITFYVSLAKKITITEIKKQIGAKPILGGYMLQNSSHFTPDELSNAVKIIQSNVDLLIQKEGTVIAYRTKVQKGITTHIIFKDSYDTICSAVLFTDIDTKEKKIRLSISIFLKV